MKKKLTALLLVFTFIFSFAACNNNGEGSENSENIAASDSENGIQNTEYMLLNNGTTDY